MERRCRQSLLWMAMTITLTACASAPAPIAAPTATPIQPAGYPDPMQAPTEAVADVKLASLTPGAAIEPTLAPEEVTGYPEPVAQEGISGYPAPEVTPTEVVADVTVVTLTPSPSATPTASATPIVRSLDEVEPIAAAPMIPSSSLTISSVGWSPDARYLLYRTHTAEDMEVPQFPPGAFFVYDTHDSDRPCTQVADYTDSQALHFWLPDNQLVYVTDQDEVVIWPVCSDERAMLPVQFPEVPWYLLAESVDHTRFLLSGASEIWLWDTTSNEVRSFTEVGAGYIGPGGGSFSPDGQYLALAFSKEGYPDTATVIMNPNTGETVQTIEWGSNGGKGGPGGPLWLSNTQFFINTFNRGPLLGTVGEEVVELAPQILGDAMPPLNYPTGDGMYSSIHWDQTIGNYHLLMVASHEFVDQMPHWLYHSETDDLEELALEESWYFPTFSPDGAWLTLQQPNLPSDTVGAEHPYVVSLRSVDPPRSEAQVALPSGDYPQWSPDWTKLAVVSGHTLTIFSTADGSILEQWQGGPIRSAFWSPDGRYLQVMAPLDANERLFLLPVEP